MKTALAFVENKAGFVAGLKWNPLVDYTGRTRVTNDVRAKTALAMAHKIVIHSVDTGQGIQSSLGMYSPNEFDDSVPKDLHSLAVAFVQAFPSNLHQILAWRIDEKKVAVIIVQNGLPEADEIKNDADAKALIKNARAGKLGFTGHVLYTNDPENFGDAETVDTAMLAKGASKASRLTKVPVKPIYLLAGLVALLVIVGGAAGSYIGYVNKQKAEVAKKMAATDPVPAYLDALSLKINKMGLDRKSLVATLNSIGDAEVWNRGWTLTQIECAAGYCISTWDRNGGTTAGLLAANPRDELMTESTSEKIKLRRTVPLTEGGAGSREAAVASSVALKDYVNTYQIWRNANLVVTEQEDPLEFKTWPTPTFGDISRLPKDITIQARPISVTVPYPLAAELIASTPTAVWWESFVLKYAANEAAGALTVTLQGKTYVK